MLVDKQGELISDLLFTVHQHGGDDVTRKPPKGNIYDTRLRAVPQDGHASEEIEGSERK